MSRQKVREKLEERAETFDANAVDIDDPEGKPDLEPFYGTLEHEVRMLVGGYSNLLLIDAPGGLGKTHNVKKVLKELIGPEGVRNAHKNNERAWIHQAGFTTPVELYKTLWQAQDDGTVLFLDDMSGLTNNTKALNMLKAATDTEGEENWVEYRTSKSLDHPRLPNEELPNTFCFRGNIVMSFNDTPDNRHFDAFTDRGSYYDFNLSYNERMSLIREIAKVPNFSDLSVIEQQEVAEWLDTVTDASMEVSLRTFQHVCQKRAYGQDTGANWEKMALDVFDLDYEKYLIVRLREESDMSVEEQIEVFEDRTGKSRTHYYNVLSEIKNQRMD